jgi:GH3 auxin-responsive promoter
MTLAPRFLVNFWAGYRVSRFVRQLKALGRGIEAQRTTFARLMAQLAGTEFGRNHGLAADTSYEQFRANVPPRNYAYFQPFVQRMAAGEADVLSPGRCHFFVETAGTTTDRPRLLPVPEAMLKHYRHGLRDTLYLYAARVGHTGVFLGRHLHTGPSVALTEENGAYRTSLDGMLMLCLTPWVEANLHSPPPAVANLPDGPEKISAIVKCMLSRDVTLVGGSPAGVLALSRAAREAASTGKRRMTTLQAMWPNLECFLFSGTPLGLYADALRTSLGPTVNFHEIYAAAEGVIAAQDEANSPGLRLLTDAGLFFEFLPLRDFNEDRLDSAGAQCLPLEKVQPGIDYVLLVTTPAGLCRYLPGDIVRFVSVDPPRLLFAGRTKLQLNAFGERVTERELLDTLVAVCQKNGWQAVSFHVAPYRHRVAAGQTISCHEWWLELRTHTIKTPTANVLGPDLDAELIRRSSDYAAKRANRSLDFPSVRLVMPGVFDQWAQSQAKTASASKMPSCRSDRLIADQLDKLTHFHQHLPESFTPFTRPPV